MTTRTAATVWMSLTGCAVMLAVNPRLGDAFSEPKWACLTVATAGLFLLAAAQRFVAWQKQKLLAACAFACWACAQPWGSTRFLAAASVVAAVSVQTSRQSVLRALAAAGCVASAIVLLQALHVDPFSRFAPQTHGRLALYGTSGNPDFAASALTVTALLAWALPRRARLAAGVLHAAALACLASWGTVLALAAATVGWGGKARRWLVLLTVVAGVGACARSPVKVLRGRQYLLEVALPHLREVPALGWGSGAVERLWPMWELDWWKARCGDDASCVGQRPEHAFAGLTDHLHCDLVELYVEGGPLGWLAFVAMGVAAWVSTRGQRGCVHAALCALYARGLVDFPFSRPSELFLFSVCLSLLTSEDSHELEVVDGVARARDTGGGGGRVVGEARHRSNGSHEGAGQARAVE